jgi:formylglycine-generating enzyme required for sulfatase activity
MVLQSFNRILKSSPLIALLSVFFIGCGGEAPVQQVPQRQPEERKVGFAPKRKPKVELPKGIDLSGVDPNTIYELAEVAPPNYRTTGNVPPGTADDYFDVSDGVAKTDYFEASVPDQSGAITVQLPNGFLAVENSGTVSGLPKRIISKYDNAEMALIPRGVAILGSNIGPPESSPEVKVFLDDFYISVKEVSLAQFAMYRRHAAGRAEKVNDALNFQSPAEHPALGVSWRDARTYAKSTGRDLPTEAQWEYAARGTAGYASPWGASRPLWRTPRTIGQIDPIGFHPDDKSIFGVMDMAGNAREWVLDFYRPDTFESLSQLSDERKRNWAGPRTAAESSQRVVKGNGPGWTLWAREGVRMTERVKDVGFRCVLNIAAPTGG